MATSSTRGSSEASDRTASDSVYDFLYHDARRVGSLLAQLSPDGHLQGQKRFERRDQGSGKTDSVTPQLGPKNMLGIGGTMGNSASDLNSRGLEETFDPLWANARALLDHLHKRKLIARDISTAGVGSIVLVSGKLIVSDIKLLQGMYEQPALRRQMLKGMSPEPEPVDQNRQQRRSTKPKKADTTDQEALLEIISLLPHTPHLNLVTEDFAVWSTINPADMIGSVADIILKHGAMVAGEWSMVGILDARPIEEDVDGNFADILTPMEMLRLGIHQDSLWKLALGIADPARAALGRPLHSYGATPLIIFREIAASAAA